MALDDQTHKDLHLIFKSDIDNIRFAKKQQWRITYYALILMVGIKYLAQKYKLFLFSKNISSSVIIWLIAIAALVAFGKCEWDICTNYRKRLRETRQRLSSEFKKVYQPKKIYGSWLYDLLWILFLCGTIVVAALLLIYSVPITPRQYCHF